MPEKIPSYKEIIEDELSKLTDPINVSIFIDKILAIKQSSSKKPRSMVRQHLVDHYAGSQLTFLDKETIAPLRLVMPGVRFRITLDEIEANKGVLSIYPNFMGLNRWRKEEDFTFQDESGSEIPISFVTIKLENKYLGLENENSSLARLFSEHLSEVSAISLKDWMRKHNAKAGDSILLTFESWHPKRFKLEFEPKKETLKHKSEIEIKDKEFADILFDMLENSASESIYTFSSFIAAYMRLSDTKSYPGSHWYSALMEDGRMQVSSFDIRYAGGKSLLDEFIGLERPIKKPKLSPEQKEQVYVFKASLKYRTEIWRRIEIKGKQTLAKFDDILRDAFLHDSFDHLSGFWKIVQRGKTKRIRKIDLGDVDPDGEGEAADITIAEIGLNVNDRLIYVYDFGDWVEHEIILEAINQSEKGAKYPRIIEKSVSRKHYCRDCKAEGKKTEATYICIECSDDEGKRVYVCEECLEKNHEDHYADEILS